MIHNGLGEGPDGPRYEILGAPDVVDLLMGAQGTLQMT